MGKIDALIFFLGILWLTYQIGCYDFIIVITDRFLGLICKGVYNGNKTPVWEDL